MAAHAENPTFDQSVESIAIGVTTSSAIDPPSIVKAES
jgi:hypothetical protein